MTLDQKFDVRDAFQEAFAKLVAEYLDKCDSPADIEQMQYMLQDCTSIFGCTWTKHSTKFRLNTSRIIKL